MNKRPDFKTFKEKALKNTKVKAAYEALRPEFELVIALIKARKKAKISQESLAKKLNIKQPSIARLEKGGYVTTSIANLFKYADALGCSIKISVQTKKRT